jgi:hypothetical protein
MNAQERISRLHGLLARIRQNAGKPRATSASAPPAPAAAPSYAPAGVGPSLSAADQSVDDLLRDSAPPPGLEAADTAFASARPTAEGVPMPSVSPASAHTAPTPAPPAPPPLDDAFGDSEVSEVRSTSGVRELGAEVTVAAIEAEAEPMSPEELSDEDLVEVIDGAPPPPAVDEGFDDADGEDEDLPPASSQRSKVAVDLDATLSASSEQLAAEAPLKTPPPQSGPQTASVAFGTPPAPDVDALLDVELEIPTREALGPTPEQLGQTVELEEGASGAELELDEPAPAAIRTSDLEELEVTLPGRLASGGYDDSLVPPPEARDDLEAHRRRLEDDVPPPPESLAQLPSLQPGSLMDELSVQAPAAEVVAETAAAQVVARPAPLGAPETFTSLRERFEPRSFGELLDASLSLGGE